MRTHRAVAASLKWVPEYLKLLCFLGLLIPLIWNTSNAYAEPNVIIGNSTGLPDDGTIRRVTFARSGDDLVTTFQVKGIITKSYSYQIAIVLYERHDGDFSSKILTYCNPVTTEPQFFVKNPNKSENIRYTIQGDTWTAWTPLSLMSYRVHFWVWVGVARFSSSYGTPTIELVDSYPGRLAPKNFEVGLPARLTVRLQPPSIINDVKLKVGGRDNAFSNDEFSAMVESGASNEIAFSAEISSSVGARYVPDRWSDSGSMTFAGSSASRFMWLDSDTTVTLYYKKQFLLSVSSAYGTAKGDGWYDDGATARFSVEPIEITAQGFLGTLGVKYIFSGWSGESSDASNIASLSMDRPKTVTANWRTTYGALPVVIAIPVAVAFVLFGVKKRKARAVAPPSASSEKTCIACGAKIPSDAEHCDECGAKQP